MATEIGWRARAVRLAFAGALCVTSACGEEDGGTALGDGGGTPTVQTDAGMDSSQPAQADGAMPQGQQQDAAPQVCTGCDASAPTGSRPFTGNGFYGKVDGSETLFTNFMVFNNKPTDERLMVEALAANYQSKWRLFVPPTPGTYECDDKGEVTVLQLITGANPAGNGVGSGMGSCTVKLETNAGGKLSGTFSAKLETSAGVFKTVTDGVFYYDQFGGGQTGGDGLGADAQGASFIVDGTRHTYGKALQFPFEIYAGVIAQPGEQTSPGAPLGIQIHSVPNEPGTYRCGEGASYRALNIWFYWKGAFYHGGARQSQDGKGPAGNSCTVTVKTVGTLENNGNSYKGTFDGTFSGTFVKSDGASVTVTDGEFRLKVP